MGVVVVISMTITKEQCQLAKQEKGQGGVGGPPLRSGDSKRKDYATMLRPTNLIIK